MILFIIICVYMNMSMNMMETFKEHKEKTFPSGYFLIKIDKSNKCLSYVDDLVHNGYILSKVIIEDIDIKNKKHHWLYSDGYLINRNNKKVLSTRNNIKINKMKIFLIDKNKCKDCIWKLEEDIIKNDNEMFLNYEDNVVFIDNKNDKKWKFNKIKDDEDSHSQSESEEKRIKIVFEEEKNIDNKIKEENKKLKEELNKCKSEFNIPIIITEEEGEDLESFSNYRQNDIYDIKNHKDYKQLMEKLMYKGDCLLNNKQSITEHPDYHKHMSKYAVIDYTAGYPLKYIPISDYNARINLIIKKHKDKYDNCLKQFK